MHHLQKQRSKCYSVWCHSSSVTGKMEVCRYFFHKSIPHQILDAKTDDEVLFIFIKCNILGHTEIAKMYAHKHWQLIFFTKTLTELTHTRPNSIMQRLKFSPPGLSRHLSWSFDCGFNKLNKIRKLLYTIQLCNAWRPA